MTELTDRYVAATLRTIPEKQRPEIEAELRASIGDAVEARVEAGENQDVAEKEVLTDLGDPDRLAAGYAGRPPYLIGPELFFDYKRLLTVLLITVVPIVVAVVAVAQAIGGESFGSVVGGAIGVGISVILHIAFWTTLVFALIERSGEKAPTREWTLASLPSATTTGSIKLSDTIGAVVALVLAISALTLSRTVSFVTADDGSVIPFFNPDLWDFWMPFLIGVLLLEVIFEVVKYRVGRWTWTLASVNLALNVVVVVPAIFLLLTDRVFNAEFYTELGFDVPTAGGPVVTIAAVVIVLIAAWDIVDGFRKANRTV